MTMVYGRDLDLNMLRVFTVVAETKSVTGAAARLYVTQPAVSAALRRLTTAVGAPLFVRQGRGLTLTARGERLFAQARPHLAALVDAALSPTVFDPATSTRTLRVGISDGVECWLLPALLARLEREAPRLRVISLPVQFRNLGAALTSQHVDVAVSVADDLPAGTHREDLFVDEFVCLYDPRHALRATAHTSKRVLPRTMTLEHYFACDHVIVTYNGDLRGIVEDALGRSRRVRCSMASFAGVGDVVDGSALVATVPTRVARHVRALRPHLRAASLPFALALPPVELIWREAVDDDDACRFLRGAIATTARAATSRSR
jgi:LysR family transcriptional regulator, mexEF-oprN operon transcriptional activator